GNGGRCRSFFSARVPSLPFLESISITIMPDSAPVGMPRPASGYLRHQRLIVFSSVVASLKPLGTKSPSGCLPWLLQSASPQAHLSPSRGHKGKIGLPRPACLNATPKASLALDSASWMLADIIVISSPCRRRRTSPQVLFLRLSVVY